MNTPTDRAARFAAYTAANALERIAATLQVLADARPDDDQVAETAEEAACELAQHADALREAHGLNHALDETLARLTGANARQIG